MKLYIKATSSYRSDLENIEIKKELKKKHKLDTRRQDDFIHLAIYGAKKLQEVTSIDTNDELYLTSGVGNIDILQKTGAYVCEKNQFITPFDFINMLGNTTSYYVATSMGMKGKNIFQISDTFTVINSLISIYCSLQVNRRDAVFGAIDFVTKPSELLKRVLGVDENCELVSSVNYQKLSLDKKDALGELEFDTLFLSKEEVQNILKKSNEDIYISKRCNEFDAHKENLFFQTELSYSINSALNKNKDMLYIDFTENKYKVLRLKNLK